MIANLVFQLEAMPDIACECITNISPTKQRRALEALQELAN